MKNILIPLRLNLSNSDDKLIEMAISHAKQLTSKCWLTYISTESDIPSSIQYLKDCKLSDLTEEHRKLQQIVNVFEEHKIDNEGILVRANSLEAVKSEMNALHIDLLILGSTNNVLKELSTAESISLTDQINTIGIPTLVLPNE